MPGVSGCSGSRPRPFPNCGCRRRSGAPRLGLALGRHAELASELAGWCAAEPLRERFAALRMLALYRSGRQADALAAYQQARRMLVDELGVEPGEELRRLHQQILTRDPALTAPAQRDAAAGRPDAAGVVPRQLPASVACFAGRSGELEVLAGLAEQAACGTGGMVVISAIGGTAGVGKTAPEVRYITRLSPDRRVVMAEGSGSEF